MKWVKKIIEQEGGLVRYITAKEKGRPCWYYLELDIEKYSEYKKALKSGNFTLTDYGKILKSGWGEKPDEETLKEMKERYNV